MIDSQFGNLRSTIHTVDPASGSLVLKADLGTIYTPILGLAAANRSLLYIAGTDNGPDDTCHGLSSCLLVRVVLDPASTTPSELVLVGPIIESGAVVTGITGLSFREDGVLYAISQDTDGLYTVDTTTGAATRIGTVNLDLHGGDITFDGDGRVWIWTNIGAGSGLYDIDPVTTQASAFDLHSDLTFAGMAALAHTNLMYGASVDDDHLYEIDSTVGLTGTLVTLRLDGLPFDYARGDLDSPFCTDDAACEDPEVCTADACSPGGCLHVPISGCCLTDLDCADTDLCTIERCVANRCESSSVDPDDGDPCTLDTCDPATGPVHTDQSGQDADDDGVPDCTDRCLGSPSRQPVDANGCSVLQLCPCEGAGVPGAGRGEFLRCVTAAARRIAPFGRETAKRRSRIIREAVRNSCGNAGRGR